MAIFSKCDDSQSIKERRSQKSERERERRSEKNWWARARAPLKKWVSAEYERRSYFSDFSAE